MKKFTAVAIFAVIAGFSAIAASSQELAAQPKQPVEEIGLPPFMPLATMLADELTGPLQLNKKQAGRVEKVLHSDVDKMIENLSETYKDRQEQTLKQRYALEDIQFELYNLRNSYYTSVRELLDDSQKEKFDSMVYTGFFCVCPSATCPAQPVCAPKTDEQAAKPAPTEPPPPGPRKMRRARQQQVQAPAPVPEQPKQEEPANLPVSSYP